MTIGLGTLAYGAATGALAIAAVFFGAISARRRVTDPVFTAFAVMAGVSALSTLVTVVMQKSSSVERYEEQFKLFGIVGLFAMAAIVLLIAAWTGGVSRNAGIAFGIATIIIGVLQLALPSGLLAGEVTALREVTLFGESFVVHVASDNPWRPALDVYLLGTLALIVTALVRQFRRGPRDEATIITVGVILLLAFGGYDSLVDAEVVDTPYIAPFGSVLIVVAGAFHVAGRMARDNKRLELQAVDLEMTVVDRTAALIAANDKLEEQVAKERTTIRRLEVLTTQFESVNRLGLKSIDEQEMNDSLNSALESLVRLLRVESVALQVPNGGSAGDSRLPPMTWHVNAPPSDDPRAPIDHDQVTEIIEPVTIADRTFAIMAITPRSGSTYDVDEQRFAKLAAENFAGFLHRLELKSQIAAAAIDAERHRIARELHDSVTQRLYSIAFLAEAVPRQLESDSEQALETVKRMRALLLSSLAELRVLLFELQPKTLAATNLPALLEQLTETVASTMDVPVDATIEAIPALPPDVKIGLYRIAQEALSNAVRHSGSASITVSLIHDAGTTTLTVSDLGIGFDSTTTEPGNGLANLRERASQLGASLEIIGSPGAGTDVIVRWTANDAPHTTREILHQDAERELA